MKTIIRYLGLAVLGFGLFTGCSKKPATTEWSLDKSEVSGQLKNFVAAQESQSRALAAKEGITLPPEFETFYKAAEKGDWQTATNSFETLQKRLWNPTNTVEHRGSWWPATMDAYGVFELFPSGGEKYAIAFGNDIIKSIPDGSVYFGGTDPGRFLVTALSESHADGKPFFTLTQNALADGTYLQYLRGMYDGKIYTPSGEDSQRCFQEYLEDAKRRQQNHQLKPGEDVRIDNGRVQVSGQVAVMSINALLTKVIFDKNPDREFYIEESFPLDWMYPHLEPHGLIFKINRQPLTELSAENVQRDHEFWVKYIQPMIGDWLDENTSVETVTTFAEKVFLRHDFSGFQGDPSFVQNHYSCNMYSKLRSSIAGLYVWRMNHAANSDEKERMAREADFAYRQALALCPYSDETVNGYAEIGYVNFLKIRNREADAVLVSDMFKQFPKRQ